MCHLANFRERRLMIKHDINKVINKKERKGNKLFRPLIKENIKYIQFNQFFKYYTRNMNKIKESPKIRAKTKGNSYETEI